MTCQSHIVINKQIQDHYSKVPTSSFLFFCLTSVVFSIALNPPWVYFHDQVPNHRLFGAVEIKWIPLSPPFDLPCLPGQLNTGAVEVTERISEGRLGWLLPPLPIPLLVPPPLPGVPPSCAARRNLAFLFKVTDLPYTGANNVHWRRSQPSITSNVWS